MSADAASKAPPRLVLSPRDLSSRATTGSVVMSIPDTDPDTILPLVRWLGAEAEILEPAQSAREAASASSMRSGWPMPDRAVIDRWPVARLAAGGICVCVRFCRSAEARTPIRAAAAARALTRGSPSVRQEAAGAGISERTLAALDGLTFDERVLKQDRGQPTPVAELSRIRRPRRLRRPARARPRAAEEARRDVRPDRARLRRARAGHRRLLGAGDRLRRVHGRILLAPLAGDARLRLPPPGPFSRRADRRAAAARTRRPRRRRR